MRGEGDGKDSWPTVRQTVSQEELLILRAKTEQQII
jgi:hypothetical protein